MSGNSLAAVAAEAAEGASKPSAPAAKQTESKATPAPETKPEAAAAAPAKESGQAPDLDSVRREAAAAERARIVALDQLALPGCDKIIEAAKTEGSTPEQAAMEMVKHLKATGALEISKQMATAAATVPAVPDTPHDPVGAEGAAKPKPGTEEAWRAEFAGSEKLQGEFANNADAYVAFRKAHAAGRARISGQREG